MSKVTVISIIFNIQSEDIFTQNEFMKKCLSNANYIVMDLPAKCTAPHRYIGSWSHLSISDNVNLSHIWGN